jgi:hypothetical protein
MADARTGSRHVSGARSHALPVTGALDSLQDDQSEDLLAVDREDWTLLVGRLEQLYRVGA